LTLLIAQKDPLRHPRVAARWLLRYLEESDDVTIEQAAMAASCLAALGSDEKAPGTLRAIAERATRLDSLRDVPTFAAHLVSILRAP
jgi:hypothetical protein